MKSPYEILGINESASDEEIKKAYRKKAFTFHPDRNAGNREIEKDFIEATEAYNYLLSQKNQSGDKIPNQEYKSNGLDDWAEAYNHALQVWTNLKNKDGKFPVSGDWTVGELEEKLINFFEKNGPQARLEIYSKLQQFQTDAIRYWMFLGLIEMKGHATYEQSGSIFYGLTNAGIEFVGRKRIE